jgi:hypothetical protein
LGSTDLFNKIDTAGMKKSQFGTQLMHAGTTSFSLRGLLRTKRTKTFALFGSRMAPAKITGKISNRSWGELSPCDLMRSL